MVDAIGVGTVHRRSQRAFPDYHLCGVYFRVSAACDDGVFDTAHQLSYALNAVNPSLEHHTFTLLIL